MKAKRYHPLLVALHWLLAVLLIALLAGGTLSLKTVSNASPDKLSLLRIHMAMGSCVLGLMFLRLVVRLNTAHPLAASTGNALLDQLAPWVHWILYLLVFAMVGSGIGIAASAGLPDIVFSGLGQLPVDFSAFRAYSTRHRGQDAYADHCLACCRRGVSPRGQARWPFVTHVVWGQGIAFRGSMRLALGRL